MRALARTKLGKSVLVLIFGIFCISAAIFNWEWFYSSLKINKFLKRIGRTPSRIIYGLIGAILIAIGVYLIWDFCTTPERPSYPYIDL